MIRARDILESLQYVLSLNERNISNIDDIEGWIRGLAKKTPHTDVKNWLNKTLRNYMISNYQGVSQIRNASAHAPSWLVQSLNRGDQVFEVDFGPDLDEFEDEILAAIETMNNLYPSREYDKMVKSPVEIVLEKSREGGRRLAQFAGIEETGVKYPDGCRWVKLKTYATIEHEGMLLANCLKDNPLSFADKIDMGKSELWSLRDSHEKPIVHVEIEGHKVSQIAGFQNSVVPVEHRPHVFDIIERGGFTRFSTLALKNIEAVQYKGKLYDENKVPGNYEWGRDLINAASVNKVMQALENGADPNGDIDGKLPLVEQARRGFIDVVELLVEHGADIEGKDSLGQSAFFAASIYAEHNWEVIKYLVSQGADVDTEDGPGNTPLMLSAIHNQPKLAKFLLDKQMDKESILSLNVLSFIWGDATSIRISKIGTEVARNSPFSSNTFPLSASILKYLSDSFFAFSFPSSPLSLRNY